jgi:hypothetical protein
MRYAASKPKHASLHPKANDVRSQSSPTGKSSHTLPADEGKQTMKSVIFLVGGLCAAAAGFLVWNASRVQPVEELAHRLEEAWADHHTVV